MPDLKLVPSGVALLCDKGAGLGGLQATNNGAFYVHEEPAATEADLLPVTNIMPCGVCSILHGPCLPQPLRWNNVHPSLVAGPLDAHPLLENSSLQCLTGGTIRILFAAEAAAVANDLNNAAIAKQRAQEAKEAADGLFWAGVAVAGVAALVVGVAAVVLTGGAALPLVAAVGAVAGLAVGATAGAVEGYGHGGWEGAKQGAQQGAVQGLLMGAAAGAVSAIGLGAALLPSVAAFGWGVANDAAALYYQPNLENGLVLAGDVVILIGGRTVQELAGNKLAKGEGKLIVSAPGGGAVRPAVVVREIVKGEKIANIESEAKYLTFSGGVEHAVIKRADGKRYLVSGGSKGIELPPDTKVLYGHTHPPARGSRGYNAPSIPDRQALERLNQSKQYIYHDGQKSILYKNGGSCVS